MRSILDYLLVNPQSCLVFQDITALLPPGTKKRDVTPYLKNWFADESGKIKSLNEKLSDVSQKLEQLHHRSNNQSSQSLTVSADKKCFLCDKSLFLFRDGFLEGFFIYQCNHGIHRSCVIERMAWYLQNVTREWADSPDLLTNRDTKMIQLVQQVVSLRD